MTLGRRKINLDHDDFTHHILFVAGTGGGKTTYARNISHRLRKCLGKPGFEQGVAVIFIDPKGVDAPKMICEVPDFTNVLYLDPTIGFSFNPLALPPHDPADRDRIVSLYIGHFKQLVESWFAGSGDLYTYAPRMSWLFESTLRYLYRRTDTPVFGDITNIAHIFLEHERSKVNAFLTQINQNLRDTFTGRELATELEALKELPKDAWFPILNRLSRFATDPFLSKIFNIRRGTVDLLGILEPGHLTIIRAAGVGEQILGLFISAVVLGTWFNVRYRYELLGKHNLVVVIGDELHTISAAMNLDQMLSQARAFNLGLAFFLQDLYQLEARIRKSLMANAHTQIVRLVSGSDADEFLHNWGITGDDASKWRGYMTKPPEHRPWVAVVRTRERQLIDHDLPRPPRLHRGETDNKGNLTPDTLELVQKIAQEMAPGFGIPAEPLVAGLLAEVRPFERLLPEPLPSDLEWRLMLALHQGPTSFYRATQRAAIPRTKPAKEAWEDLKGKGAIVSHQKARASFKLSASTMRRYFEPEFSKVAKSSEGQAIARAAYDYHIGKWDYIIVAPQRLGEFKVDLIAYRFREFLPIAIEVESASEIKTHAEQVAINIKKFRELGFARLELWFPETLLKKVKPLVGDSRDVELHPH